MTEFELKFQIPPGRAAAVEAAVQRGAVQRTHLRARYFDTPDEALARNGLVLRVRQEGREHVQTAKGRGPSEFERLEHNVPLAKAAAPDPSLHAAHPVGKALRRALDGHAEDLRPVFETDIVRRSRVLQAAGTAVEIALDQGRIRADGASVPVLELEFELKEGSPAALVEVAQRWCEEHQLWLDPLTKAQAGWRLAHKESAPAAVSARPVEAADSRTALLASILDAGVQQVLGNARELAAGSGGDEHVHQLRVGLRRVRTALRDLQDWSPLVPPVEADVAAALQACFAVLGEHRDRSTLLPVLRGELEAVQAPLAAWDAPLPDLAAAVRDPAFQQALLKIVALVQELLAVDDDGSLKAARKSAGERLQKLHRKALRAGHDFTRLAEAERHRVRKRLKRLRYLGELVRPLFDGDAVDAYVKSLKDLQDALGAYQDVVAGKRMFAEHAALDARAWFGAGWLAAREEDLARDCEEACRHTKKKALRFWT